MKPSLRKSPNVGGNIMKRYKHILTLILVLTFGTVFAHQDFWMTKDFGNVKVRIKTGFEYEEITKVFIIGQLAEQFSKQLNYTDKIFLDFKHHYTGNCDPDYFISFDKGKIEYSWSGADKEKDFLMEKSIVVRQVSRQFEAETTLKLLEYAIQNVGQIKSSQKVINYNKNYCQWTINSIDTTKIDTMLLEPQSIQLKTALSLKIDKPEKEFKYGLSYFFKDNKYSIFSRGYNKEDKTLLTLDNIYDLRKIGSSTMMIFDTDSTFYYVNQHQNKVSKQHSINNKYDYYRPYKVENIGGNKISINFSYYSKEEGRQPKNRTLIYLIKEDDLIQDLDKLIEKR
jgi:hypothetical protein